MSRTEKTKLIHRLLTGLMAIVMALSVTLSCGLGSAIAAEESFRPDNEDLYFGAFDEVVIDRVVTTGVIKGDFKVIGAAKAEIIYENTSYIFNTISAGKVRFQDYMVEIGDYVQKGDPIYKVRVSVELEDLVALETSIATREQNLAEYIESTESILDEYRSVIKNNASFNQRKMAELLYDRLSVSFKSEKAARQSEIDRLKDEYNTALELTENQYIKAPSSGVVGSLNWYRRGDTIDFYAYMGTVYDTEHIKLRLAGGSDKFRYNQKVLISQTQGSKTVDLVGRVVTCKNAVLAPNLIGNSDYVEVYGDVSQLAINKDVTVRTYTTVMENALLVDKNAVYSDAKGSYVYIYKDGTSMKQYVLDGGSNTDYVWIVSGLSEGDLCVVK